MTLYSIAIGVFKKKDYVKLQSKINKLLKSMKGLEYTIDINEYDDQY